uniref:Calmegin n=1 Tax=Osmerus mordax TaxID=8014 RepID=C1BKW0_OSMMO|nr:Calmegin precursor [Osmerus mordax]
MLMLACLLVACVFHQSSWCSTEAQSSYISPPVPERAHFAESFDSGPLDRRWVRSQAVREEDTVSLLYDGEWAIEEREAEMHPGNKALVMKSSGRHHAVAAYLHTPFHFRNSPLCLQYEVMFMEGVECSGAYIKLLSLSDQLRLSQFSDVTPYSVMFGPDMCGGNHKMHLIVTVTDPLTGQRQQRHAPQPDGDLKGYFTDRKSHLYTLLSSQMANMRFSLTCHLSVRASFKQTWTTPQNFLKANQYPTLSHPANQRVWALVLWRHWVWSYGL